MEQRKVSSFKLEHNGISKEQISNSCNPSLLINYLIFEYTFWGYSW